MDYSWRSSAQLLIFIHVFTLVWSVPVKISKNIVELSAEDEEQLRSVLEAVRQPLFEGDLLDIEPNVNMSLTGQSFTASSANTWPKGRIPYAVQWEGPGSIDTSDDFVQLLGAAMEEIQNHTCIRFESKTIDDEAYLRFVSGPVCSSYVGMQPSVNYVIFDTRASGCRTNRKLIHELMHAVGFYHEMSRDDRDDYVEVISTNIKPMAQGNFQKYREQINTRGLPFDVESVMMYEPNDFAIDPKKETIKSKDPHKKIGGSQHLTDLDILSVNMQYHCPGKRTVKQIDKPCPNQANVFVFNAHCYFISPDPDLVSFVDAKKSCASKGSEIASFPETLLGPFVQAIGVDRFSSNIFWLSKSTGSANGSGDDESDDSCYVLLPGPILKLYDSCDDFNNYICMY